MGIVDNVISNWTCSEASGTIEDTAGSNDGTNNGAAYGATGKLGDALDFENGDGDYVNCGTSSDLFFNYDGAFSGVAWINPETLIFGNNNILSKMDSDSPYDGFQFNIRENGKLRFSYITTSTSNHFQEKTNHIEVSLGSLQLVGFTYDNETLVFYRNGSAVASSTVNNTISSTPSISDIPFSIGSRDNEIGGFDGIIGSVTVWSRALSAAEHLKLWNDGDGLAYPFSTQYSFTKTGKAMIAVQDSFTKTATARISIQDNQFTKTATSSIQINDAEFTKTGKALIYIGTISGQVTNQSVPVVGAKISVMQSDDDDMTNMELVSVETSDGSGNWSAHIDQGKVGWASAYYKDGTDLYRSKAHGYLEVV